MKYLISTDAGHEDYSNNKKDAIKLAKVWLSMFSIPVTVRTGKGYAELLFVAK